MPLNGGTKCPTSPIIETCDVDCEGEWGIGECDKSSGTRTKTWTTSVTPQNGGTKCPTSPITETCDVDCEWSDWEPWSNADEECGTRTRTKKFTRKNNGSVCTDKGTDNKDCPVAATRPVTVVPFDKPTDCGGETPIFDETTNNCRARTNLSKKVCLGKYSGLNYWCKPKKNIDGSCKNPYRGSWFWSYCRNSVTGSIENVVNVDANESQTEATGGGPRWIKLYEGTMPKPEKVTSFSMSGKIKDQGWGNRGYGEIMAIGSYNGSRSWQKQMYQSHPRRGRGWETIRTSGTVDYSKSPATETPCSSRGWPRYTMPEGNGTRRCGGVPEGKTDKIEIWHHNRKGYGHYGYAKDVNFEV
jgi:hypothetical protein